MGIWGKSVPGIRNRQHKSSEAVMCLACSRSSKKASVANVEREMGRREVRHVKT